MSHLEDLVYQYHEWQGYIVRRNIKVGRLPHGGWEGELDIVAYHPETDDLVHLEPSIDADSWKKREERFARKFRIGRKHIFRGVFPWLSKKTPLRQVAVLITRGKNRTRVGGGHIWTIDEMMCEIRKGVVHQGPMVSSAIPEQFDLLRTIQMCECGYHRRIEDC